MFGCIVAVAGMNAWYVGSGSPATPRRRYWMNRYALIAEGMVASIVLGLVAGLVLGWQHWPLAVETALITLFAVFWALQTRQLWSTGLWFGEGPVGLRSPRAHRLGADPEALEVP